MLAPLAITLAFAAIVPGAATIRHPDAQHAAAHWAAAHDVKLRHCWRIDRHQFECGYTWPVPGGWTGISSIWVTARPRYLLVTDRWTGLRVRYPLPAGKSDRPPA